MGIETRIIRRCGVAVAALAVALPTTIRAATHGENPMVGGVACLSEEQRAELVRREMHEFLGAGAEMIQERRERGRALSAKRDAAAALTKCEEASANAPGAPECEDERRRMASANEELSRVAERQEKAQSEFPMMAARRILAIRAEYPACDSR
jgi:RNase H-fold protein (predicted Holliday junction resolvase)